MPHPHPTARTEVYVAERDQDEVRALWHRVFGIAAGGQTPQWLFRPNPAADPPRVVVRQGDRVVAHAGAVPVRMVASDRQLLAGWSVGAMTDPACRGQGLFVGAARALYSHMADLGFDLVGGFSNANSARLHTEQLGRTAVRPFPWAVRLVLPRTTRQQPLRAVWPTGGRYAVAPIDPGDPRIDQVWAAREPDPQIQCVRDAAWSSWRYGERPQADYRLAVACDSDGKACAWIAVRALRVAHVPALFVLDLQCAQGHVDAAIALVRAANELAASAGCAAVSVLLPAAGALRSTLIRNGFIPVPEPLHPKKILLSVRQLNGAPLPADLHNAGSWSLAWSDTDVV